MAVVPNLEIFGLFFSDDLQSTLNVTISKSTFGGRGLFATQFLKKGSLLFINKPIVFGPRADCKIEKFCSNCYQINDSCSPCEKCHAFVCSEMCKKSLGHMHMCSFICENWCLKETTVRIDKISLILGRILIYLRFLLLPEEQKSLLRIFQHSDIISKFPELDLLQSIFCIPQNHIDFFYVVHSLMKINCFRISSVHNSKRIELRGFYPLSTFMNHSCIPNTRNMFTSEYAMAVFASKDIEKGEEITCCYTGIVPCTPVRRLQLFKAKQFWCKCSRCSDKTENGTNLSALKCFNKECIGILLPKIPLNPLSKWLCDTCLAIVSLEEITMIHSVLGSLVGTLNLDDDFKMDNIILKRLAEFIPFSNHIFVDIRMRLAFKLGLLEGCLLNGTNNRNKISYNITNLTQ